MKLKKAIKKFGALVGFVCAYVLSVALGASLICKGGVLITEPNPYVAAVELGIIDIGTFG